MKHEENELTSSQITVDKFFNEELAKEDLPKVSIPADYDPSTKSTISSSKLYRGDATNDYNFLEIATNGLKLGMNITWDIDKHINIVYETPECKITISLKDVLDSTSVNDTHNSIKRLATNIKHILRLNTVRAQKVIVNTNTDCFIKYKQNKKPTNYSIDKSAFPGYNKVKFLNDK